MSQRNYNKNKEVIKELEKTISPVLVVNNSSLKPYVELFEYSPENIYQQPLGSLVGFFEVKEYSEDSAYIVNHLTAVLKKEYYINPKRPVTESLDSALHKVNLALSEIARIGNVQWLGKINAAICVLEKNNAHFSTTGNAKIFLHRKQILSEISEGLAFDSEDPHPLKTFVNVSSGRLEKNDRLLITSADIFHILSTSEINKNFQRFEGEKFVQFLKTALSNQMEMIASVVIEMTEVVPVVAKKNTVQKKTLGTKNVFSEKTFANSHTTENLALHDDVEIEENQEQSDQNYTDKKTGHIYIQGEANNTESNANSQIHFYQDLAKEKITQGIYLAKNEIRKRFSLYKKQLAKKRALRQAEKEKQQELRMQEEKILAEQRAIAEIEEKQRLAEQRELEEAMRIAEQKNAEEKRIQQEALAKKEQKEKTVTKKQVSHFFESKKEDTVEAAPRELSFREKLELAKLQQQKQKSAVIDLRKPTESFEELKDSEDENEEFETEDFEKNQDSEKKVSGLQATQPFFQGLIQKSSPALKNFKKALSQLLENLLVKTKIWKNTDLKERKLQNLIPHFSKIKELFSRFTTKQKRYTFFALVLIFIVPIFIAKFLNKPSAPTIADIQVEATSQTDILANDKNMKINTIAQNVFADKNIIASLIANDTPTAITQTSIVIMQNGQTKEFSLPSDAGKPVRATYMKDLSLIFIITDASKVISFSPVSEKFTQSNNIDLSGIAPTSFIGTYLTYLYVLDQKTNQIYRFPRAEGGFGEKTSWLKDPSSFQGALDMTIDDNIYIIQGNKVSKFFKGKISPLNLETSYTPVVFNKIYTNPDLQSLYVLDTQNSRIIQYNKDGNILAQFYNETLRDGSSFAVNEQNKTAYIATPSGLISVSLQ